MLIQVLNDGDLLMSGSADCTNSAQALSLIEELMGKNLTADKTVVSKVFEECSISKEEDDAAETFIQIDVDAETVEFGYFREIEAAEFDELYSEETGTSSRGLPHVQMQLDDCTVNEELRTAAFFTFEDSEDSLRVIKRQKLPAFSSNRITVLMPQ